MTQGHYADEVLHVMPLGTLAAAAGAGKRRARGGKEAVVVVLQYYTCLVTEADQAVERKGERREQSA